MKYLVLQRPNREFYYVNESNMKAKHFAELFYQWFVDYPSEVLEEALFIIFVEHPDKYDVALEGLEKMLLRIKNAWTR